MSILSKEADGCGFYYAWYENDPRQVNVRYETGLIPETGHKDYAGWFAYVGDDRLGTPEGYGTKHEAEEAAIAFLKTGRR